MAKGLVSMAAEFGGLPMKDLIGGPLEAACDANVMLAKSTSDYINTVGFNQEDGTVRQVDFKFERPVLNDEGLPTIEAVKIQIPMLAIVPIPNLQVDNVDISFDMEVRSATSSVEKEDKEAELTGSAQVGWGPFSASVEIRGKTSAHKENIRSSDNSAKYHVQVQASNADIPEGLSRVLDIMADAAEPRGVVSMPADRNGNILTEAQVTQLDDFVNALNTEKAARDAAKIAYDQAIAEQSPDIDAKKDEFIEAMDNVDTAEANLENFLRNPNTQP